MKEKEKERRCVGKTCNRKNAKLLPVRVQVVESLKTEGTLERHFVLYQPLMKEERFKQAFQTAKLPDNVECDIEVPEQLRIYFSPCHQI